MKTQRTLALFALLASATASAPAEPTAHQAAITAEALRPNADPAGRALPLVSRWTAHNWVDEQTAPTDGSIVRGVDFPFPLSRVLDDIEDGQPIVPFFAWPFAANMWTEPVPQLYASFERLAPTGLPFEVLGGNLEDGFFNEPDLYWHRPMAENPAHIRWDIRGTAAAAPEGATEINTFGWNADQNAISDGYHLIFSGHGRVYQVDGNAVANAEGQALIRLRSPLLSAVAEGETVARIDRKLDFFSAASTETFEEIGAGVISTTFGTNDAVWAGLAERYPNPPKVQVASNNEGVGTIRINDTGESWHFHTRWPEFAADFPEPREDEVYRLAFARGYIELFGAYLNGMKNQLPWPSDKIDMIGYNAFGTNFEIGRWGGWREGMIPYQQADTYQWLTWDGAAPDFYAYDWNYATDQHVGSPHIGAMQSFTMLAPRAEAQVPDYQWQLALWDGGIIKRYSYASWGEIPATSTIGTLSIPLTDEENGLALLPIEGAEPNTLILRNGEFISIAGNSEHQPARATALYDEIELTDADGAPIPQSFRSTSIGYIDQPAAFTFGPDQTLALAGGGRGIAATNFAESDSFHLLAQPRAGDFTWSARLFGLDDPSIGLPQFPIVEAPGQADFVDPDAVAQQQAANAVMSGGSGSTKSGLMIRADTGASARYVALLRTGSGGLAFHARTQTGVNTQLVVPSVPIGSAPVALRLERSGNTYTARYALEDGDWIELGSINLDLGLTPHTGFAVTAGNSAFTRDLLYTVGQDIMTDAEGRATVPLMQNAYAFGVIVNGHHGTVEAGAPIRLHNFEDRYEGLSVMALWLTRPRVVREFAWGDYPGQIERHWGALLRATKRIWDDADLTRFWRQGTLVVNQDYEAATGFKHPFWELTDHDSDGRHGPWLDRWQRQDRFYQLNVAINPPFNVWPQRYEVAYYTAPLSTNGLINVWAIAYELGEAPNREWLLITQSPRRDRSQVAIEIPGYGEVSVDVQRRGSFYLLQEGSTEITPVGQYPLRPGASLEVPLETAAPTLSPAPGTYEDEVTVLASSATPGATLRYTTDGTEPTEASPVFPTEGLTLDRSATVLVRAFAPDRFATEATRGTYRIVPPVLVGPVTGPNLLQNPGFEWAFDFWGNMSATHTDIAPRSGSFHSRVTGAPGGHWQIVNGLTPATTYRLTVWGRNSTAEDNAYLYVKNYDGSAPDITSAAFPTDAYTQRTLYFTTGPNSTSAEMGVWKTTGSGYADIDDFDLRATEPPPAPGTLAAWRLTHFTEAQRNTPAISGNNAAPSGDGMPNLLKYYLGLDPWVPTPLGSRPVASLSNPSAEVLSLSYWKNRYNPDATGIVEWSETLAPDSWSADGVTVDVIDQNATREMIEAQVPTEGRDRLFLRLRVTPTP